MTILIPIGFYVLGLITGACGMVSLTLWLGNRSLERKRKQLTEAPAGKLSLEARMKRVKDLTDEQMDLLAQIDQPQKNGLDGRHKNGLNSTVKDIEKEKAEILRSILEDGYDPEISAMDMSGVVSKMKLSEFMVDQGLIAPPKPKEEPKIKTLGKFTVHKGGKDDGGTSH